MGVEGDDEAASSKDATTKFVSDDTTSGPLPDGGKQRDGAAAAAAAALHDNMDRVRLDIDAFTAVWRALGVSAAHLRRALEHVAALRSDGVDNRHRNRHQTANGHRTTDAGKAATSSARSSGVPLSASVPVRTLTRAEFCAALRFVFAEWDAWQRADTRVELVDRRPHKACSLL
jgi:hypothetical protein